MAETDWSPGAYAAFRALRLRPALDLLMQCPSPPPGDIVDLGCGNGAAAAALRARWPKRRLIGVDASPAMLARARGYDRLIQADAGAWEPEAPPGLIFSNALLHWLPDHAALMPHLAALLPPRGGLAVQMPRQFLAPSHRLLREVAQALFPGRFDFSAYAPPTHDPAFYQRLLAPLGAVDLWQTEYLQRLAPVAQGHAVRHFTGATAMRPIAAKLNVAEQARFIAAYDAALAAPYPAEADGAVLLPFCRLFFVLTKAE